MRYLLLLVSYHILKGPFTLIVMQDILLNRTRMSCCYKCNVFCPKGLQTCALHCTVPSMELDMILCYSYLPSLRYLWLTNDFILEF